MEGLRFSKTARRVFHDVTYDLSISGDQESLSIEVESASDRRRWSSKFAQRFIEEITQRTGNAKKFDVFVRMMLSALAQESDAVYLDVLTARDLEMLRRHANPQGPPTTSAAGASDKRYLILTYRAEFDKVHYPLPLSLEERSEEETLRAAVSHLRSELADAQKTIATLQEARSLVPGGGNANSEAALQRENADLAAALRTVKAEAEQLRAELRNRPTAPPPAAGRSGSGSHAEAAELRKLREAYSFHQSEIKALKENARRDQQRYKQENDQLVKELKTERVKRERLDQQLRKLEEDRRALGVKLQSASRAPSTERSRPASRSPSADRSQPPSRPVSAERHRVPSRPTSATSWPNSTISRPTSATSRPGSRPTSASRAVVSGMGSRPGSRPTSALAQRERPSSRSSSVASSRDRTPSPSAFLRGGRNSAEGRPWAYNQQRGGSPASGMGFRRSQDRHTSSPTAGMNTSPYSRPVVSNGMRRTPSPGQRGLGGGARERTPSPGQRGEVRSGSLPAVAPPLPAVGRAALSLRERGNLNAKPPGRPARYGGSGGAGGSHARGGADLDSRPGARPGSMGPVVGRGVEEDGADWQNRPGHIFGLAANLGIPTGPGAAGAGVCYTASSDEVETCDIDARLQALQSFLQQTKTSS
eukprot:gnl/TRDRNA2_/TRDRNA2_184647_c0_seq1.p1 gnl/TRDRNA2_/TRDRNA2_184647_c0~~gnl/TRDRNA2_/TRDRNA2_184647_c0_seq1.p1  ORF type:complete len:669 (-),score=94.82 gnl/TRDRNA2_/TRDRNA2_184647_c0_seq1:24-1967(-)